MASITKISAIADDFPDAVVDYEDMLNLSFGDDGRGLGGKINCIGVAIEIFRRAGLGLPDPLSLGRGIDEFQEFFIEITSPDTLYDLIHVGGINNHVLVVVRPGVALSSKYLTGVYTQSVARVKQLSDVRYFRVDSDLLP